MNIVGAPARRKPTSCACATSGHAAAPPSVAENFRRAMWLAMCPPVGGHSCNGGMIPRFSEGRTMLLRCERLEPPRRTSDELERRDRSADQSKLRLTLSGLGDGRQPVSPHCEIGRNIGPLRDRARRRTKLDIAGGGGPFPRIDL